MHTSVHFVQMIMPFVVAKVNLDQNKKIGSEKVSRLYEGKSLGDKPTSFSLEMGLKAASKRT